MNKMPNFFIVGTARSGTTSLDQYLRQHPEIYMAQEKETHYFAADQFPSSFKGPGDDSLNKRIIRDQAQYSQLFTDTTEKKAIGEASVFYLSTPGTAERIAQAVPDAKIIISLREPVARTYSSYMFLVRDGRETSGFEEGLSLEEERKEKGFEPIWWYKELSLYYNQVKRYIDVFSANRVKVTLYDELLADPKSVLRNIFTFLGVKEDIAINTSVRYNGSGIPKSQKLYTLANNLISNPSPLSKRIKSLVPKKILSPLGAKTLEMILKTNSNPIDPKTRTRLVEYFAEDVGKLEDLLDVDLSRWRIVSPAVSEKS